MSPSTLRILYVEDNDALRETMALLMEEDGREITLATDAEQAATACASGRFDLVLTDISLPGRSGADLARELLAADPEQWIVLCSGRDLEVGTRELGTNVRWLAKPFEIDDLERLIRDAAESTRGRGTR